MLRRTLLAAALFAALPPAPAAAATWSEPEVVATPATAYQRNTAPLMVFGPGGTAAAYWTVDALFADPYERFEPHRSGFATSTGGSSWSGTREQVMDLNGDLAVDRAGRATWIGEHREAEDRYYLTVSIVMRSGRLASGGPFFDRAQTIWPRHASDLRSDTNAAGASVAMWSGHWPRPIGTRRYAALRRPGKRFGRPVRLTNKPYVGYSGDAAINERGDAIVAWAEDGNVYARRAPRGRRFGPRIVVARGGALDFAFTGIDDRGRALVVWNEARGKDDTAMVAARTGSHGVRRAFELDQSRGYPHIERGGSGELLVAWVSSSYDRIRVTSVTPRRIATQTLAAPGAGGPDLAALPDGTAALLWNVETKAGEGSASVSIRSPGGEFGPAETAFDRLGGTIAIDPVTRQPVVGLSRDGVAALTRRRP
jgi:hypothetical protein